MAGRGRPAAVFKVYDRQKRLVFTGTGREIAKHFNLSENTVHNCFERGGRLLWEYNIVQTDRKENPNALRT